MADAVSGALCFVSASQAQPQQNIRLYGYAGGVALASLPCAPSQTTKNIVRYKANELPKDTQTDWARIDAMTEKKLKKNAQSDEDTLWADKKFWQVAQLLMPAEGGP